MNINFEQDILEWSNQTISRLVFFPSGESDTRSRLAQVFGILRNMIPPKPRKIEIAKGFSYPEVYVEGYKQVLREIEEGIDLTPRGSRKQTKEDAYNDPMLLDWNIYHLHLGNEVIKSGKNKGLVQGHKEILFVFFENETAYIIGVFDHSSWTKQEVLEIIFENWPQLIDRWKIERAIGLSRDVTDTERKSLRNEQINSPIKIGNNVYMGPGGGMTTSGSGTNEIEKVLIVLRAANKLKDYIKKNQKYIQRTVNVKVDQLNFDVSRFILSRTFSVHDRKNKFRIFIPSDDPAGSLVHPAQASIVEPTPENYSFHNPDSFSDILVEST